jgi:predicted dehydrogenase
MEVRAGRDVRVAVVGSGPAGRRLLRHARALGHEAALVRRADLATEELAGELGAPVLAGLADAERWAPEAVVAADPPSEHLATAGWAIEHGLDVLVEKPLAASLDGVAALLARADADGVRLEVAYNLRFHSALAAVADALAEQRIGELVSVRAEVGSRLPDWHPELDHRTVASGSRALGGGAALTLSHELDYVLWTAGPVAESAGFAANRGDLEIDADTVAEIVLRHADGAIGSVHVDLIDPSHRRGARWVGTAGTIAWEAGGPAVLTTSAGEEPLWDDPSFDLDRTYAAELEAFLGGVPFPGDARADAVRVLEVLASLRRA